VGVVEAADTATKAAAVDLLAIERVDAGLVMIAITGDVASVQGAVAAGAERASVVGELVSSHVIPRPDSSIWKLFGLTPPAPDADTTAQTAKGSPEPPAKESPVADSRDTEMFLLELKALPVRELRKRARAHEGFVLSGREISRASKTQLLDAFRDSLGL
jgi:ethanolamine utilization protein EutM